MTVRKRCIGDRDVHPVGLGCMNITHAYGPPIDETEAKALLTRALDLGCDFLDTATIYGLGRSEELIGGVALKATTTEIELKVIRLLAKQRSQQLAIS